MTQDELKSSEKDPQTFGLTSDELFDISQNPGWISLSDWNLLGDSFTEKQTQIYLHLSRSTQMMIEGGVSGYFWIVASEGMCGFLELTSGFQGISFERDKMPFNNQRKLGTGEVNDRGTVWKKWRLYECDSIPPGIMIIGCGNEYEDFSQRPKYLRFAISNYVL